MMMLTIPAGVYRIRNRITGEVYVGSGRNIYERIKSHIGTLERGSHHNRPLQTAWITYGPQAFAFSILEVTPTDQTPRIAAENRWMDKLRLTSSGLYNQRPARAGCFPGRRGIYRRPAPQGQRPAGAVEG